MSVDKQHLSTQIREVFVQRGYDGATLVHLANATGLSKASLYHHFPRGKAEMAATLIHQSIADLQRLAFTPLTATPDPAVGLVTFVQGFSQYLRFGASDCILSIFTHHTTAHEEIAGLQRDIHQQFSDWHAILSATLVRMGYKTKRANREAHELIAAIYGALMNAKLHAQPALFERAMNRLAKRFTKHQPGT